MSTPSPISARTRLAALVFALAIANARAPAARALQEPHGPTVSIGGEVAKPLTLSARDLAALPRFQVTVADMDGKPREYSGVLLRDLLKHAGALHGDPPRGGALAMYVLVEARDGYRAVFALAEIDPSFTDRVVLLADTRDGSPIPHPEGPFRLVVPDDKRPARWVRQVTSISVCKVPVAAVPLEGDKK